MKLLVCDFDNTLYDWVGYFVTSFYKMLDTAATVLECDRDELVGDFRQVHRRFGDAEHPYALLETEAVRSRFPGEKREQVARRLDAAFYAFNRSRKATLHLYPGVLETLAALKSEGVQLVGHTEARFLAVADRLERLNLAQFFDTVYCRERGPSSRPDPNMMPERTLPTRLVELSHHQAKPSAEVLLEICAREGFSTGDVAYVGDSLFKDILMANRAGVVAIWAKYGTVSSRDEYEQLVRVSHWTDEDIQLDKELRETAGSIRPDAILEAGFHELMDVIGRGQTNFATA